MSVTSHSLDIINSQSKCRRWKKRRGDTCS